MMARSAVARLAALLLLQCVAPAAQEQPKCAAGPARQFVEDWLAHRRPAAQAALCPACAELHPEHARDRCAELCRAMADQGVLESGHRLLSWLLLDLLFHLAGPGGCLAPMLVAGFADQLADEAEPVPGDPMDEGHWHRAAVTVALNLGLERGLMVVDKAVAEHPRSEALSILKAHLLKRDGKARPAVKLLKQLFGQAERQELLHAAFSPRVPTKDLVAKFSADQVLEAIAPGEPLLGLASEYNLIKWEMRNFQAWGTAEPAPDLSCDPATVLHSSPTEPNVLLALPLVASEQGRFKQIGEVWREFPPCTAGRPEGGRADLMLLFSGKLEETPEWLDKWSAEIGEHLSCFGEVYVSHAGLTDAQIRYAGGWDVTGPNNLLHAMISHNQSAHEQYDYMLWMESDVYPIQQDWLARVIEECRGPRGFWRKGSIQFPLYNDVAVVSTHHRHMNSNGLYRLGDECFTELLQQVKAEYGTAPNDAALYLYLHSREHFRKFQRYAHKFAYTDMLQNWLGDWCRREVLEISPNTVLVHGKHRKTDC